MTSEHLGLPRANGDPEHHYKSMDSRFRGNDKQGKNSARNSPIQEHVMSEFHYAE